jgi:hypothetical protein
MPDNFDTVAPESTAPVNLPVATKLLDDAHHAGVSVIVDASGARAKTMAVNADGSINVAATVSGGATAANQSTEIAALASILTAVDGLEGKDYATQTTLAAVLAKLTADPATQTTLAAILAKIIAAPATEAKQDTGNTSLATIAGKDFATQTTLASILAALASVPVTGTFWQATQPVSLASVPSHPVTNAGTFAVQNTPVVASAAAVTSVNDQATSTTLLASNASRRGAAIFNDSTEILYVKFGATASLTDYTIKMAAGSYFEFPVPCYTGVVDGIWANNSTGAAKMTELT